MKRSPPMVLTTHGRYVVILAVLFAAEWISLAIDPVSRSDWALENVIVAAFVIVIAASYSRLRLSKISYTLIFVFLCFHEIGAHYTYSLVPYDAWFEALTGSTLSSLLGLERNHFDRGVHFLYGLLLAYPIREVFLRVANVRGFWGYFLPLDLTMSTSMMFELFEWGAAELVGGDLGMAYLGTQGDQWDAHKDMALASLGALLAMSLTAMINVYLQRDFAQEWIASLRVKGTEPLGEQAIRRLLENRSRPADSEERIHEQR
jgi:putative membrane protein